jgi:hypothetical protein
MKKLYLVTATATAEDSVYVLAEGEEEARKLADDIGGWDFSEFEDIDVWTHEVKAVDKYDENEIPLSEDIYECRTCKEILEGFSNKDVIDKQLKLNLE